MKLNKIVFGSGYGTITDPTIKEIKRLVKNYNYSELGISVINNFLVIDFFYF